MFRTVVLLLILPSVASAQGFNSPVIPPFTPRPHFAPVAPFTLHYPSMMGFGGSVQIGSVTLGAGFVSPVIPYAPYYGFGGGTMLYTPSQLLPAPTPIAPPTLPNLVPPSQVTKDLAEAEFHAALAVQFPAPADVWLNGKKIEESSSMEKALVSPPLKVGGTYAFDIKATWRYEGKDFQTERTVVVKAGERSKLTIFTGDPVR